MALVVGNPGKHLFVTLLCVFWIAPVVLAQNTYYVATSGNNNNSGKTINAPWRSINYAAQQAKAGDVVLIRGGTYYERIQISNSGTSEAKIVFKNYADEKPVIDGSTLTFPDDYQRRGLFEINAARHIRVEGLSAVNATKLSLNGCGFLVNGPNASHITISRCTTDNTPSSGIAAWGNTGASDYTGVRNLVIENCTVAGAMNGGFQEHITIAYGVENYEVRNNTVRDGQTPHPNNYPIGIDSKINVRNGKIYGNEVYNLKSSNGIYVDAWDNEAYNIEIYDNVIHDVDGAGIPIGGEQGGTAHSIKVFNNVVYNAGKDGLKVNGAVGNPATDPTVYDISLYNNTVYNCQSSIWVEGNTGKIEVYNNIFSKNTWNNGIYIYASNASNVTASHNLIDAYVGRSWNDPVMKEIRGTNAVEKAPLFVDAAKGDFRLSAASPAIDAGTTTNAPPTDFAGNARPAGAGIDLGAYEYGASVSPPPATDVGLSYALYGNKTLSGNPIQTGTDATVNFDWQYGGKASGQPIDNFSLRWTGQVQPAYSQEYTFYTQADDGTRLWVDGKLLVDDWTNHAVREKSGKITLEAGKKYDIKLEYFENGGEAVCKLLWSSANQSKQVIPKTNLYPVSLEDDAPTTPTYTIRAKGVAGTERMALLIGGETVKSWTVSTSMQDYQYTGEQTGPVRVAITNDQGKDHDLVVDQLTVDGTVYQAEDQPVNTGVWQGQCGGSYSEWLHCAGYIEFDVDFINARQANQLPKQKLTESSSTITLYPNPTSGGTLTLSGVDAIRSQVSLHGLLGQRISVSQHVLDAQRLEIQFEHEATRGLYILQIHTPNGPVLQRKVVIE